MSLLIVFNLKLDLHRAIIKHNEIIKPFLDVTHHSVMSENFRQDLIRFPITGEKLVTGKIPDKIFRINSISILKDDVNILHLGSRDVNDNKHLDYTGFNSPILMASSKEIAGTHFIDYSTKSFLTCNRFYKIFKGYLDDIKLVNHHDVVSPLKNPKTNICESSFLIYEGGHYVEKKSPTNQIEFYELSTPREIRDFQEQIILNIKTLTNLYNKTPSELISRTINRSYKIYWYIKSMADVNDVIAAQENLIKGSDMFNKHIETHLRTEQYQQSRDIKSLHSKIDNFSENIDSKIDNFSENIGQQNYLQGLYMMQSHMTFMIGKLFERMKEGMTEDSFKKLEPLLLKNLQEINESAQNLVNSAQYSQNAGSVKNLPLGLPSTSDTTTPSSGVRSYCTSTRRRMISTRRPINSIRRPISSRPFCSVTDPSSNTQLEDQLPIQTVSAPLSQESGLSTNSTRKTFITPIRYYLGEDTSPDSTQGIKMGQTSATRLNKLKVLHEERQITAANCKKLESEAFSQDNAHKLFNENIKLIEIEAKIECLEGTSSTFNNINKYWPEHSDDFLMKFEGDCLRDVFVGDDVVATREEWEEYCKNLIPGLNAAHGKEKYTSFNKFNLTEHSSILLEPSVYMAYDYKIFSISTMFTLNEDRTKERISLNIVVKFDPTNLISSFIKMLPYPPTEDISGSSWIII